MKNKVIITEDLFLVPNQFYISKRSDGGLFFRNSSDVCFSCDELNGVNEIFNYYIFYGKQNKILLILQESAINECIYIYQTPDLYVESHLFKKLLKFLDVDELHCHGKSISN